MLITNLYNKYLRLSSAEITALIANISDYTAITLTGTKNCKEIDKKTQQTDAFENNSWGINFADAVLAADTINKIIVVNTATGKESNVMVDTIDLAYVIENCANDACIMEDYSEYFAALFKNQIDTYFTEAGLISDVVIDIIDNIVYIDSLPAGFHLKEASYESSNAPTPALYTNKATETSDFFIGIDGIYVVPSMFNEITFTDGIYKIDINLQRTTSHITDSNCLFIDITFSCKVAAFLIDLIRKNEGIEEKPSTMVHLLHYGLVNGSNCSCYCDELCMLFDELNGILTDFQSEINTDCGC